MSYNQYPDIGKVNFALDGYSHEMKFDVTPHSAPPQIEKTLTDMGWSLAISDPTTHEPLYTKQDEQAADFMYYRWYEAMAYEFWKFLTVNSGNDKA